MKGATKRNAHLDCVNGVSIHAPMKGATVTCPNQFRSRPCFNPRTHEGCDFGNRLVPGRSVVSIHAPMKGATRDRSQKDDIRRVSIHAPLARCDFIFDHPFPGLSMFQSTHLLRGATRYFLRDGGPSSRFNPRTSCEVRLNVNINRASAPEFQSTHLLRGATSSHTWFSSVDPFQSTHLLRGATDCRYPIRIQFHVSIHAPLARCDRPARTGRRETAGFNPRTSCEVRHGLSTISDCF